jgi:hypothetical protein
MKNKLLILIPIISLLYPLAVILQDWIPTQNVQQWLKRTSYSQAHNMQWWIKLQAHQWILTSLDYLHSNGQKFSTHKRVNMTLLDEQSDRHWTVYYDVLRDYKEAKDLLIVKATFRICCWRKKQNVIELLSLICSATPIVLVDTFGVVFPYTEALDILKYPQPNMIMSNNI